MHLTKIEGRIQKYKIEELNAPRAGKHLLVLDIDYTLFGEKKVYQTFLVFFLHGNTHEANYAMLIPQPSDIF